MISHLCAIHIAVLPTLCCALEAHCESLPDYDEIVKSTRAAYTVRRELLCYSKGSANIFLREPDYSVPSEKPDEPAAKDSTPRDANGNAIGEARFSAKRLARGGRCRDDILVPRITDSLFLFAKDVRTVTDGEKSIRYDVGEEAERIGDPSCHMRDLQDFAYYFDLECFFEKLFLQGGIGNSMAAFRRTEWVGGAKKGL